MEKLFVYGTLIKPLRDIVKSLPAKSYHCKAYVYGELYNIGNYPGLVIIPDNSKVYGELFYLPEDFSFKELDAYEDFFSEDPDGSEYLRLQNTIITLDSKVELAWVYIYNRPVENLQKIPGGHYEKFLSQSLSESL